MFDEVDLVVDPRNGLRPEALAGGEKLPRPVEKRVDSKRRRQRPSIRARFVSMIEEKNSAEVESRRSFLDSDYLDSVRVARKLPVTLGPLRHRSVA